MADINSLSIVNTLDTGASPKGSAVFKDGQVLFGKVVGLFRDQVILNLCGRNHLAETALPLFPGESIRVRVDGTRERKVILRLLDQSPGQATVPLRETEIKSALANIGVFASDQNTGLAKALIESGMPVTKDSLNELLKLIYLAENGSSDLEGSARAVLFLKLRDVPVTSESVGLAKLFLRNEIPISDELSALQGSLSDFLSKGGSETAASLSELAASIADDLKAAWIDPREAGSLAEQVRGFLGVLGYEHRLISSLLAEGAVSAAGIQQNLKGKLIMLNEDIRGLIGGAQPDQIGSLGLDKLLERATSLIRSFSSLQLCNQASSGGTLDFLYFPIPVRLGDTHSTADVRIFRQAGGGKTRPIDASNFRLAFLLETPNLGAVNILLDVVNQRVHCQIGVESETTKKVFLEHLPSLKEGLKQFNFALDDVRFWSLREEEKPGSPGEEGGLCLGRVDIKV